MANDIFAQRMALRSNALGGIMQALAQIKQKQDEEREQADIQKQIESALFQTTPAQQFNVPTNANVPSAMPTAPRQSVVGGRMQPMGFAGTPQQQMTLPAQRQFNPTPEALLQLLINPKTAPQASTLLGGMKTINDMKPKQQKFSQGFSDFLAANAEKYAGAENPLELAYSDYQNQQTTGFETKEQIKSKYRPQASTDAKRVGEYTSEDGFKVTIFRNPDGGFEEVKSQERVREQAQSPTMQKEEQKLSTLQELSSTIRQQAKPEYLGGVTSGLAGQGFGGTLGGVREATGLIGDEEAQFRANVASLKNQLLYLRSGAQINESEFKRLEKELPDPTQPQNVFLQRLNTFDKQLNDILRAKGKTNKPAQKNNADPLGIR